MSKLRILPPPAASKDETPKAVTPHAAAPCLEFPGNFIGSDWLGRKNVKELAYGLRVNAALASLAYKGLRVEETEVGTPRDDVYALVDSLVSGVATGAYVLAAELGALPEESA